MKLYFRNSSGNERVIAEVDNEQDAFDEIKKFLSEHNYTSYYTRIWDVNGRRHYDVGSWSEKFILDLDGDNNGNNQD